MASNPSATPLEAQLELPAVISISVSSMLGSGIFVLPGVAVALTGNNLWLAYLIAAICVIPAALSKSELATAMPTSGGTYVYLDRTFGPLVGTVAGLGLWLSLLLKSAFALIGIGTYLTVLIDFPLTTVALSLLVVIVLLNIMGVGKVSGVLIFSVLASIGGLLGLSVLSLFQYQPDLSAINLDEGGQSLLMGAGLVFVSYAGVTKVAAVAEEIKNPERNIPIGILSSLGIVTVVYCVVTYLLVGVVNINDMDLRPIYQMAVAVSNPTFGMVIAMIAILTMASMANAGVLAASRFPFAMARDGLLPASIGKLGRRFLTPHLSIILSGVVVAITLLTLDVTKIAKLASAFMLIIYLSENVAVVVLRETRVQWYQPKFKSPLYPFLQVFGALALIVLLGLMGPMAAAGLLAIGVPGVILFFLYSRHRTERRGVMGIKGKRADLIAGSGTAEPQRNLEFANLAGNVQDSKVVVALFGQERSAETLAEMGVSLADGAPVEVVHLTEVPEQASSKDFHRNTPGIRSLRRRIRALGDDSNTTIFFDPVVSHDIFKAVYEISERVHCSWLLKEWGGRTHGAFTLHRPMGWLEDHLKCNVLTFRDMGVRKFKRILVHFSDGNHDDLILDTVNHLAVVYGARVTFSAFRNHHADHMGHLKTLKDGCTGCDEILEFPGQDEVAEVIAMSAEFDLLILEAEPQVKQMDFLFGRRVDKIIEGAGCSVICLQGYYGQD